MGHRRGVQPVVFALALSVIVAVGVMVAVALPHLRGGAPVLTQTGWRLAWKVLSGVQKVTRRAALGMARGVSESSNGYPAPPYPSQPYAQQPHAQQPSASQPYPNQQAPYPSPQYPAAQIPAAQVPAPQYPPQAYPAAVNQGRPAPAVIDVRDPQADARRVTPPGPQRGDDAGARAPRD
jgi:hypothetical protein